MQDAETRMLFIIPISLGLIFILLYSAFKPFLDAIVVFTNVFDVGVGGIWALYLTGTNFSVSAAVGFVSLFGIAIMEGLLMISYFNALRPRAAAARGDRPGSRQTGASGHDHGHDCHLGSLASGAFDKDRLSDSEAACHCGRWRHDADVIRRPLLDARAL